jgi:hypothetical protein
MAARTTSIKSVAVAVESGAFAAIDSGTGISDPAGLSFTTIASISRADVATVGESVVNDNADQVRSGPYAYNGEVATMWSGGSRVRRRRGDITLTFNEVQGVGDGSGLISTYASLPLWQLLRSGLAVHSPSATGDTVAAGVGANSFTSTAVAGVYPIGGLFGTTIAGRAEYSAVTDRGNPVAPDTINHSPAMSVPLTNEALRFLETFYPAADLDVGSGTSVTLRLDGIGFRTYAYGCRVREVSVSVSGDRAQLVLTLSAAYVTDDHASASVGEPSFPDGAAQHLRGSYVLIGSTANPDQGAATPHALDGEALQVNSDSVTFTISSGLAMDGRSDDIAGMSDWCVTDTTCTGSLTVSVPTATLDDDQLDRVYRSLLIGFGPQGVGDGFALYVPSAFLTSDGSLRDAGGDTVTMTLNFSAGPWRGDVTDGAVTTDPVNAPFRLGLSR